MAHYPVKVWAIASPSQPLLPLTVHSYTPHSWLHSHRLTAPCAQPKPKLSKQERRQLQEEQRAKKAAAGGKAPGGASKAGEAPAKASATPAAPSKSADATEVGARARHR